MGQDLLEPRQRRQLLKQEQELSQVYMKRWKRCAKGSKDASKEMRETAQPRKRQSKPCEARLRRQRVSQDASSQAPQLGPAL